MNSKTFVLFISGLLWTGLILLFAIQERQDSYETIVKLAAAEAKASYNKDLTFRKWGAIRGGVYVAVTEESPPNPYLGNIPERDISTPSGRELTLFNPAYMTRQIHELAEAQYGIKGHITSLTPLRSENRPDPWETTALESFEKGVASVQSIEELNGNKHLRAMFPMYIEEPCLKCHVEGYNLGDIRGGISVSVPLDPYLAIYNANLPKRVAHFLIIWGLGMATLLFVRLLINREFSTIESDLSEANQLSEKLSQQKYILQRAQEIGAIGGWRANYECNRLELSEEACQIFGLPLHSKPDLDAFLKIIHPDDHSLIARKWQEGLKGKPFDIEHRIVLDGKIKWVRAKADVHFDASGRPVEAIGFSQDITERKLTEDALRESEERFRLVFKTNPDPVILSRFADGTFLDVNAAFESTTGFPRQDVLGKTPVELALWANQPARAPMLKQLLHNGEINNIEADFRMKNGQIRTGLISARLLKLNDELFSLVAIRDITTEKAAERALIEMDQMKNEFISTAAHELRTPLSAIMGFTEFLRSPEEFGGFTEQQKQDFLNDIYDRGESLSRIIDDLLDISRIESGHPGALDLQKCDFKKLMVKSVDFFRTHHPGHTFRLDLPTDPEPQKIRIDRHRIKQVLENLLSNAVKYSPEGSEIMVKGWADQYGWKVNVEDRGIGMTPEQVKRIFDKFYRADASDTAVSGLGLGMSIAKQIVEAHGGEIRVESIRGQGSTVMFNLPFTTA